MPSEDSAATRAVLSRVVTFANGKGGVGKTSLSTNFAGLAALAGWKTLFLEFDPQGNAGHDLGYGWQGLSDEGRHMLEVVDFGKQLAPVLTDVRDGLDVVPMGRSALMDIEDVLSGRERRGTEFRTTLAAALSPIAGDYDLIVIDTPPTRPKVMQLVLGATRWLVVPTKVDRSSIAGLGELAAELAEVHPVNPQVELLGVVLFDVDTSATVIRRNAEQDINQALDGAAPLFDSTIRHSAAAIEARGQGKLVHELAESAGQAEPWYKALKEGRKPARIPGTVGALAEDHLVLTDAILTRIAAKEEEEGAA